MRVRMWGGAVATAALMAAVVAAATQSGGGSLQPAANVARLAAASGPASADHAAAAFIQARHGGPGSVRVLSTEPDVEHGVAVYDVRILGPDGVVYVVQVQRGNDKVLSASRVENQGQGSAAAGSGSPNGRDAPDHSTGPAASADQKDQPDTSGRQSDG